MRRMNVASASPSPALTKRLGLISMAALADGRRRRRAAPDGHRGEDDFAGAERLR